jgi:hypothetical protein
LADFFLFWMYTLKEDIKKYYPELFVNPTSKNKDKIYDILANNVDGLIDNLKNRKFCDDFKGYTQRAFSAYTKSVFDQCVEWVFEQDNLKLTGDLKAKLRRFLYYQTVTKEFYQYYSGLIFVGYGENEIYPQLIPVHISFVLDEKLRFFVDDSMRAHINSKNNAIIRPFAQIDVINTILAGIDPELDFYYMDNFQKFLNKYNQLLAKQVEGKSEELAEVISGLSTEGVLKEYIDENRKIRQDKYIFPLLDAVASLSKEDLAEMAESLIYLTYLKRRITFKEESVGGPVDVALITKGDGFIWIKRKHYFDPKLNHHFFKNYLK